jgi:hypothetical protein
MKRVSQPFAAVIGGLHPKIILEDCVYCVAGVKRYVCHGRIVEQPCAHCAGRGTIVTEAATVSA